MTDRTSLPRVAKGKRPQFFEDKSVDHLVTMVMELSAELYSVYGRLDSLERYLAEKNLVDRKALDAFIPDEAGQAERLAWRELLLERLFRTISADRG